MQKIKKQAEKWINFLCRPDIAKKNFDYITYSTPNTGAYELSDEELQNNEALFPDMDSPAMKNSEILRYLGDDTDNIYNEMWKEVNATVTFMPKFIFQGILSIRIYCNFHYL